MTKLCGEVPVNLLNVSYCETYRRVSQFSVAASAQHTTHAMILFKTPHRRVSHFDNFLALFQVKM